MMRHIYITANRAWSFEERNVALACESSKTRNPVRMSGGGTGWPGEPRSVAFTNLLSRTPLRGPRADFRGGRGAPDDQGSRHEGRDRRRGVPECRSREHDHRDVPDHDVTDGSG